MLELDIIAREIEMLAAMLSSSTSPKPSIIFRISERYMEAAKIADPKKSASKIKTGLAGLWNRSVPWLDNHLVLRRLHPDLWVNVDNAGEGYVPVLAGAKLARNPQEKQKELLAQARIKAGTSPNRLIEAIADLNALTFGKPPAKKPRSKEEKKKNGWQPSKGADVLRTFFSGVHKEENEIAPPEDKDSPQEPRPTPMPAISTLPDDDQLEAVRKHFTLTSYRPGPRTLDLPPIPQPKAWDPDKVARVEKGARVRDT